MLYPTGLAFISTIIANNAASDRTLLTVSVSISDLSKSESESGDGPIKRKVGELTDKPQMCVYYDEGLGYADGGGKCTWCGEFPETCDADNLDECAFFIQPHQSPMRYTLHSNGYATMDYMNADRTQVNRGDEWCHRWKTDDKCNGHPYVELSGGHRKVDGSCQGPFHPQCEFGTDPVIFHETEPVSNDDLKSYKCRNTFDIIFFADFYRDSNLQWDVNWVNNQLTFFEEFYNDYHSETDIEQIAVVYPDPYYEVYWDSKQSKIGDLKTNWNPNNINDLLHPNVLSQHVCLPCSTECHTGRSGHALDKILKCQIQYPAFHPFYHTTFGSAAHNYMWNDIRDADANDETQSIEIWLEKVESIDYINLDYFKQGRKKTNSFFMFWLSAADTTNCRSCLAKTEDDDCFAWIYQGTRTWFISSIKADFTWNKIKDYRIPTENSQTSC